MVGEGGGGTKEYSPPECPCALRGDPSFCLCPSSGFCCFRGGGEAVFARTGGCDVRRSPGEVPNVGTAGFRVPRGVVGESSRSEIDGPRPFCVPIFVHRDFPRGVVTGVGEGVERGVEASGVDDGEVVMDIAFISGFEGSVCSMNVLGTTNAGSFSLVTRESKFIASNSAYQSILHSAQV